MYTKDARGSKTRSGLDGGRRIIVDQAVDLLIQGRNSRYARAIQKMNTLVEPLNGATFLSTCTEARHGLSVL